MHEIRLLFFHFNSFVLFLITFQDVNISILAQSIHIHCIPAVSASVLFERLEIFSRSQNLSNVQRKTIFTAVRQGRSTVAT